MLASSFGSLVPMILCRISRPSGTFNTTQAERDGKVDEAAATEQLRQRFLSEHLGAWIEPFSAAVTANAQTAFYRELAALTRSFVQAEMVRPVMH